MPPIFKAVITISVWVLFITACLGTIVTGVMIASAMLAGETVPMEATAHAFVSSVTFILACVGAWLRKKVE